MIRTIEADILSDEILSTADAICFTSNGIVKSNGELVMGAGVAKQFADKFPGLAKRAGDKVSTEGNAVAFCGYARPKGPAILSFPTKDHWKDPSTLSRVIESANELKEYLKTTSWEAVYLPAPGIGLGGLEWEAVKAALEPILPRSVIITFKPRNRA